MVATTVLVAVLMTETVLDSAVGHINASAVGADGGTRWPLPTGTVATSVLVTVLMTVTSLLPWLAT